MTKRANKLVPCPICKENDSSQPYKPFCSSRCANVDLHRWLGGYYTVPAVEPPDHYSEDEDTFGEIY
ncbi:MAG: DNA gyrase inhibitor YacG [Rhodobiaceae bacterium]|nr:DNA gyrase inhibitor YacG [Rhodobiaceae bacterium]